MLHAAAMFVGLSLVAALLAPGQVWMIFTAAFVGVGVSVWLCGVSRMPWRLSAMAPQVLMRLGANLRGAASVARAALAADVALKPALVRLRTRQSDSNALAALAGMISASPGANVVATDDDGFLVHVLDEDEMDAERLGAIELRARPREKVLE
ncbi:MAG: Na+/H+ antiporter subunit E [Terricaulis sp.]